MSLYIRVKGAGLKQGEVQTNKFAGAGRQITKLEAKLQLNASWIRRRFKLRKKDGIKSEVDRRWLLWLDMNLVGRRVSSRTRRSARQ